MPSQHDTRGPPALSRSTRSWTGCDGNHFTVNSLSSGSGLSFGTMTGSSGELFERNYSTSAAPRRASLFSNAFSLVEDMITMQQQQRAAFERNTRSRKSRKRGLRGDYLDDAEGEDDGLAYGHHSLGRKMSVLSRIKERLLESKRSPRKEEGSTGSWEESPAPSPRTGRGTNASRVDTTEPARSQQRSRPSSIHIVVEHDDEESGDDDSDSQSRKSPSLEHIHLEVLSDTIEHERRALRACKKRLEQASRQPTITSSHLQRVIDEMKGHERALVDATYRLNKAKLEQRRSGNPQAQAEPRPRPQTYHPRHSQERAYGPSLDGYYFPAFTTFGYEPHPSRSQHVNNLFGAHERLNPFDHLPRPQSFGDFEHFFGPVSQSVAEDFHPRVHFFDVPDAQPRRSQHKYTRHSQGPAPAHRQSHRQHTPPSTPPPPQPHSSILKPAEAQTLFQSYNVRWNDLLTTDPAVPYPARGLQASSLSARNSIWAPHIKTGTSMWNDETVMQANAQAFYLGVVGLRPEYTEINHGQIECGFERSSASAEQIKQLVDMLKKEKPRWHSDRLGRRNGGVLGGVPNEALQKDVRARAVFHAVCELMDRALE